MTTKAAAALCALALLTACSGSRDGEAAPSPSPSATALAGGVQAVLDQDFPDPDLLRDGDGWLAFGTQPPYGGINVQVARSGDLRSWDVLDEDALPRLGAWATTGSTWAPEVTDLGDGRGYRLYYTAKRADPYVQCIGVATADTAAGPYVPVGDEPLVCPAGAGGAIDASAFLDEDGTRHLLWKNDGNCCGQDTWLHAQELRPDGLSFAGPPVRLVKQDQAWEGDLVEAPTLVRRGGEYVLLYSANAYGGEDYAIGYATAPSLDGPWTKAPEPLLSTASSGGAYLGPGGQDVVTDEQGRDHLVFHDWDDVITYRGVHVAELRWDGALPEVVLPTAASSASR